MTVLTRSITLAARQISRQNQSKSHYQNHYQIHYQNHYQTGQWLSQLRELSRPYSSSSSSLSLSSLFSAFEFPKATEAPVVTKTLAAHARAVTVTAPKDERDVFDDARTLSDLERSSIQGAQRRMIPTTLRNCKPIFSTPPDDIPPPSRIAHDHYIPTTLVSTLPNGVRVVSQETFGHVCSVGILANVGSTMETKVGTSHLLELTSYLSTSKQQNSVDIQENLQLWGATPFCHIGREQSLWCLDILRPNVQKGFALLTDCVLNAQYTEEEVQSSQQIIGFQWTDKKAETMMMDAVQYAAYGPDQPLGRHHFCPLDQIENLHTTDLQTFMDKHVRNNPKSLVVSGAGIGHDELVDMAVRNLGHLQQQSQEVENTITPSVYRGGDYRVKHTTEDKFTHVAIGFEVGGWSSDDLVPTCVLQSLLGGGSSFSAGGPGKGMYSRLYRQVLNRNSWAESAEAFIVFHNEAGMIGITGSSVPKKSADMAQVIRDQFMVLANQLVTDEEFDRARRMLTNSVLMQLESRLVLFEDMGRQVLAYGYREDTYEMSRKIDAVTKEDLRQLVQRAIRKPPSLAAVGDDVSSVPAYDDVQRWFAQK